ncbi:kinesin heavy chain [Reticulomyxa filosa]|uniref:Kinesin heavy chain n=1 Tax=Reticulomyxa filosa TaxID=46433 RepID=X6N8Q5_RETFI|nr:kinesin heavy chain [Reticulomyxa filosa]|eukprot:ETO22139.1 kinesin heavy chain [Reticulomyxa filosa]
MARRLEAGCINNGLSQLQVVFNELRVKGKLSKVQGTGLRRILHAYINAQCVISVLFTLSPSENNATSTASTLKFAVQAGMVKVKPVKSKVEVNYKQLVDQLKEHIEEQKQLIEKLNDTIEEMRDKYEDMRLEHERLINAAKDANNKPSPHALEVKPNAFAHRQTITRRQETVMNEGLLNNLELFEAQNKDDDETTEDTNGVLVCPMDEAEVDKKIVDHSRARSMMDSNLVSMHLNLSKLKLDIPDDELDEEAEEEVPIKKTHVENKPAKLAPTQNTVEVASKNRFAVALAVPGTNTKEVDIQQIKSSVEIQKALPDTNTDEKKAESTMELIGMAGVQFRHADTSKMNREELLDYCDAMETQIIEERALRGSLEQSQKVIIDHLMETNEGLLRWFQMKKIL